MWEFSAEQFVREIWPFEDRRWGVWAVGFPHAMRSSEDAQRNLAAVLPALKGQWQRWQRGEGEAMAMIMQHWSVFGTASSPPEPEPIVAAVRQAGVPAARAAEVRRSPGMSITFALYYEPRRAPMFVVLEWLDREEWDVNTGTWEMAEGHLSDLATLQSLRCCADVRHDVESDPAAVQAAVDFLHAECVGVGVFAWEMV